MTTAKHNWERGVDFLLGISASVLLFGMMVLTFFDVVARYLLNKPIRGAFEVTELALLVLIFAGLPLVSHADEHVTMDFIERGLRRNHVFPHLADLDQGRQDLRLRRHHRRAAHRHRAVRVFHGCDDRAHGPDSRLQDICPGRRRRLAGHYLSPLQR
jgi:hypothetical protein